MKRLLAVLVLFALALPLVTPASAARVRVVRRAPRARTTVVVTRGWPLRRPLPIVVVRPPRVVPRVVGAVYLAPVAFTAAVVTRPAPDGVTWEDGETFSKDDDWTDVVLNADARGRRMLLEVTRGRVQVDFAEIVFENGDARVVDFDQKTHGPGTYGLLEFTDGRKVDHVRVVARAKSDEARLALLMEK